MDRQSDYYSVIAQIKNDWKSIVLLQIPRSRRRFCGIVDLVTNKAYVWDEQSQGTVFTEIPIPEEIKEEVDKYRMQLIEGVAEESDDLLKKFIEDPNSILFEEIVSAIRKATIELRITPVLCGSSFKNKGVQRLLDAVVLYLPSPEDKEAIEGVNPYTNHIETRNPITKEPFSALVFKIATDAFVGRIAYFRVYSGKLTAGSYLLNASTGKKERISRIFEMHADKQVSLEEIGAGNIGAAVGLKNIRTGHTITDEKHPILLNR